MVRYQTANHFTNGRPQKRAIHLQTGVKLSGVTYLNNITDAVWRRSIILQFSCGVFAVADDWSADAVCSQSVDADGLQVE